MLLATAVMSSCSTQKNTWGTRSFHQTKVKYNIYFNGNTAFEAGSKQIAEANHDDFSQVIPLYPVSNHQAAQSSASKMDVTIEKCRKCIKLHSIKAKPKPNAKKMSDPKYKAWLKQEEFNNQIPQAWIRLGEAEFHKGDFLGSIGTFNYIQRHFEYDKDIVAQCQLWIARAYGEMGWLYEAEDVLKRVKIDDLSRKHAPLYSAASGDVLLKTKQYHEAIPFVKARSPYEKRKVYRPRFQYVLAQLYELEGKKQEAASAYSKVIRMTPGAEMEFNARIHKAQLEGKSALKGLQRMAKRDKYKDKLDQIYGAIGNVYLQLGDTTEALKNYDLAIEKSTQGGLAKAAVLLKAGDLYYGRREYEKAQPCYGEVVSLLSAESEDYKRIQKRSEALGELIAATQVVTLQDSLQRLSKLPEAEQRKIAEKIVADLKEKEKNDSIQAALDARAAENSGLTSVNTSNMLGGGGKAGEWYFYNSQLLQQGKQEFRKKWGTRTLEDNWRRLSKSVSSFGGDGGDNGDNFGQEGDSLQNDSNRVKPVLDIHNPEYYLQQIPKTDEDIHISDSLIADALYELIFIYQDKVEDPELANQTYDEFRRRFGKDARLQDLYYMYYLEALKHDDAKAAETYRRLILSEFPESKQATIVSDPNYFERLKRMAVEQDSLYEQTYGSYMKAEYKQVKANKQYAEKEFPLSPLMPRFLFLNAVAVARTEGQEPFCDELRDMVNRYPESELSSMAKDMLAMMGQGMESQKGSSGSNLSDMRGQNTQDDTDSIQTEQAFSRERRGNSYVLLCLAESDEQMLNNLLYEVALFNFTQFLLKDFDLQQLPVFGNGCALRISGFDSLDETAWYLGLVKSNFELQSKLTDWKVEVVEITEENYPLLNTKYTLEEYKSFFAQ